MKKSRFQKLSSKIFRIRAQKLQYQIRPIRAQSCPDMSSLSIFPVEVLDNVTSIITTVDQVHLWQCGDRVLSIKLKKGGLKVTSLNWTSSSWMPWPRLFFATFACMQQVEWCPATGTSFCPALEINLLPKTLLSLQINCGDIYHLLRIQNANMNELLPLLRTLDITGTDIEEKNMKHLPQNLITLSMASIGSSLTSGNLFRDLPRTIEVLKLGIRVTDTEEHGNDLPNSLKEFSIYRLIRSLVVHLLILD